MIHPLQGWLRAGFLIPLFAFCISLFSGCDSAPSAFRFSGAIMGTQYNVTLVDLPDGLSESEVKRGVHAALAAVDEEMSTYKAHSSLMRLNAMAIGQALPVSPELMKVLQLSKRVYQASQGAFDPTIGALVNAWGFGPKVLSQDALPSSDEINALIGAIGFNKLVLDENVGTASRLADVFIDLSAVAKGFGVDQAAEWLLAQGVTNFLVEVGGELRVHGYSPRGDNWVTAISEPDTGLTPVVHRRLSVQNKAVATSGDYYNYFTVDGVRYSHTIDPRSGRPVTHHLASVTVIADDCATADAYATAIDVLGPEEGLAMAEREGLAVYILTREQDAFTASYSSAFRPFLNDVVH